LTSFTIRTMLPEDVRAVVAVHLDAFPGFFLTFLGPAFLRALYRSIVRDPSGIALVGEAEGTCVSFVAGTTEPAGFYSRALRRGFFSFGVPAAIGVLRRPTVIRRVLRAFRRAKDSPAPASGRAELMSLAVMARWRRCGAGAALVNEFVRRVQERGGTAVLLTTDAVGNDAVNAFYARLGFVRSRTFVTPEGREMNEHMKPLSGEQANRS
jgi:ribosomal protein S18 acetylase RimI-like enzyme